MKNNLLTNKFNFLSRAGIFIILTLPLISISPFFYPQSWTKLIAMKIILVVLGIILLYQFLFFKKQIQINSMKKNPVLLIFGLFFAVFLLASIFSVDPHFSFWGSPERGGGFINLLFYGLFGLLIFSFSQRNDWDKMWIFNIKIAATISIISLLSFLELFPSLLENLNPRIGSTIGNSIPFGMYLLLILFPAIIYLINTKNKKQKLFLGISIISIIVALFLAGSRAAYLGFLIASLYFLGFYPINTATKKNSELSKLNLSKFTKIRLIGVVTLIVFSISLIFLSTYIMQLPDFDIQKSNKIIKTVAPRISIQSLAGEGRFQAWETVTEAIKEKPILGWGPENMAIGFDKYFNPKTTPGGWWDRAHNTFLDAATEAGILGLIAYIGLFAVLFFQLHKIKSAEKYTDNNAENTLIAHGLSASLIAYVVASIFSINSFSTFLIFFFLASFVAFLSSNNSEELNNVINDKNRKESKLYNLPHFVKNIIFAVLFLFAYIFIWQYNIRPWVATNNFNIAKVLATNGLCEESIQKINDVRLPNKILGQYGVIEAVEATKFCTNNYPEEKIKYSLLGLDILEKSLPNYTFASRLLALAGSISSFVGAPSENAEIREEYLGKSYDYFQKALAFSPKSQDIILEMAHIDILKKDCSLATEKANQCIALNPEKGDCYWVKALSFICSNDLMKAEKEIEIAKTLNFEYDSTVSVQQLINAYIATENYHKVAEFYEILVSQFPYEVSYIASLAESYRLSGQYQKAKETALTIMVQVSEEKKPQAQKEIDAFIQTLPLQYQ